MKHFLTVIFKWCYIFVNFSGPNTNNNINNNFNNNNNKNVNNNNNNNNNNNKVNDQVAQQLVVFRESDAIARPIGPSNYLLNFNYTL